jgi:hypothetical protein
MNTTATTTVPEFLLLVDNGGVGHLAHLDGHAAPAIMCATKRRSFANHGIVTGLAGSCPTCRLAAGKLNVAYWEAQVRPSVTMDDNGRRCRLTDGRLAVIESMHGSAGKVEELHVRILGVMEEIPGVSRFDEVGPDEVAELFHR